MSEQEPLLAPPNDLESGSSPECDSPSWRERTGAKLEAKTTHKLVILLIVIDSACVLADLGYTLLTNTSCPGSGPEDELPLWLETLSHISLGITTFFLIEIPLQLWAFGPIFYNPFRVLHGGLHLFDAVVILTTFVLEVVLKGRERELAGLLILLRLWRLVKLVGGVAVGAGELGEENAQVLDDTRRELEDTKRALKDLTEKNRILRLRLGSTANGDTSVAQE